MAADLGISVGTAGLLVAASGLLAAISAPALTILAGRATAGRCCSRSACC